MRLHPLLKALFGVTIYFGLLHPTRCAAQTPTPDTYKAYVSKAAGLNAQNRLPEAIAVLDQVITLKPDYVIAYYNRGFIFSNMGELDSALADCNKVLELDPSNVDGLLLRAAVKDKMGDDPGSTDDCTTAIAIDSTNARAYNLRAIARFDRHDYRNIISDCDHAIALKPDYYDAYVQRGEAYDDLGNFDKAIADYTKAIALQPGTLVAYRECAASEAHKNDLKASLDYLEKGIRIEPGNSYLLGHKFRIQQTTGDYKGAITTLDQCIKYHPDSAALFDMNKVILYDSLHDNASACKFAFEALKPGLMDAYDYIMAHPCTAYKKEPLVLAEPFIQQAQKEYAEGRFYAEVITLSKVIALLPDSSSLYYNRGAAQRKLDHFQEAIDDYTKAIALRPGFPDAICSRAVAKTYLGDTAAAIKDYQLVTKTDSTYAIAYNNYAMLIIETDVPTALAYLTKAIHFNKAYTSAYFNRAKLYLSLHQPQNACPDLRKAESLGSTEAKIERMVNCK